MSDRSSPRKGHVPRVFVNTGVAEGVVVHVEGDKAHHLRNVLRVREAAPLILFDGSGGEYRARVEAVERGRLTARVLEHCVVDRESPLDLTLGQGIARGERMDFAIAKAVELGVRAIDPLFTNRGQVKLEGQRLRKKLEHWRRVAASAAEQSGREYVPEVSEPRPLAAWLPGDDGGTRLVLAPDAATGLRDLPPARGVRLLIGPESGLSDSELAAAHDAGFRAVRLGPRVLRTETAGPAALAALQTLWGDLG